MPSSPSSRRMTCSSSGSMSASLSLSPPLPPDQGSGLAFGSAATMMVAMGKKPPLTRNERRNRRAIIPDARVYGVVITDTGAGCWQSRVIFSASNSAEAAARLKKANLYKRVIQAHINPDKIPADGRELARAKPGVLFMSRDDDGGWSPWMELPNSYQHPP